MHQKRTFLLEDLLKVWREAPFDVVFVQIFLECPERNRHLLLDPSLEDFFILWKTELPLEIQVLGFNLDTS